MALNAFRRLPKVRPTEFFAAIVFIAGTIWFPADGYAKNTLVIGIRQYPANFHPSIELTSAKTYVLGLARRPLTAFDSNWRLVCMLCERLPTIENGLARIEKSVGKNGAVSDGIAATFTLPQQATWGDGTPITSDDVVFTWQAGRHLQSGFGKRSLFERITRIDVVDSKTFTLHFGAVTFDFNDLGEFRLLPAHIERPIFERDPALYRANTAYDTDTGNPGLYFGPYVISDAARDSHIVLTRNPKWWGKKPYFDRIVVKAIGDTAALQANLLSGDVDMIAGELGLTVENAGALQRSYPDRFNIVYQPGLLYEHIDVNLDNPILRDKNVRQALLDGMDRTAIDHALFEGRQEVAHSFVSASDGMFDPTTRKYCHDAARAAQLLDGAGWKMSADGLRRNAAGEPLRVEVITTAGHRARQRVLLAIQDQWRKIGVETVIRYQTPRELFGVTLLRRQFPMMVMYAFNETPEMVPGTFLGSSQIPSADNNYSGFNTTGFRSTRVDQLIKELETTLDRGKRRQMFGALQHIYADELPALPLFFYSLPYILPKWLKGVEPTGHQFPSTLWAENWYEER